MMVYKIVAYSKHEVSDEDRLDFSGKTLYVISKYGESKMPAIQIDVQLSTNKLLEAVERLSLSELQQFLSRVLALQAQRKAPHLSVKESALLTKINQGLPLKVRARLNQLVSKRRANKLTQEEHAELLRLIDQLEEAEARRAEALAQLARLRGVSMTTLMRSLGLKAPRYA
jgi:hypothetical protein